MLYISAVWASHCSSYTVYSSSSISLPWLCQTMFPINSLSAVLLQTANEQRTQRRVMRIVNIVLGSTGAGLCRGPTTRRILPALLMLHYRRRWERICRGVLFKQAADSAFILASVWETRRRHLRRTLDFLSPLIPSKLIRPPCRRHCGERTGGCAESAAPVYIGKSRLTYASSTLSSWICKAGRSM